MDYIVKELNGVVSADKYGAPAGRITKIESQPEVNPEPKPEVKPAQPAEGTYVVVAGDSLWAIAQKNYGTGTKWGVVYEANKDTVKNPGMIYIGQVLVLPAA